MGKNFCKLENKWCKFLRRGICNYSKLNLDDIEKCPRIAKIETTTLYNLLRLVDFESVFSRLIFWFSDQEKSKDAYKTVFDNLLRMSQNKHNLNDLFIKIETDKDLDCEYMDVYGVKYNKSNIRYGLSFMSWSDWITMFIDNDTINSFSNEDIVAGCLYEMTFFGFSEEKVLDKRDKMIEDINDLKNGK